MRKLAIALSFGTALCVGGSAMAADIIEPTVYDWSGVYGGVFAGIGYTSSDWDGTDDDDTFEPVDIDESLNDTQAVLGALAGINFQHDQWVFGLEADIAWFDSDKNESLDGAEGLDITSEIELLGSVRARLGYAADRTMFYLTGGAAFADAEHTWDDDGDVDDADPVDVDLDFGWVAGAGIEHAWTDNLLVRLEGLYFDLGSEDAEVDHPFETDTFEVDQEIFVGRIGISYKIN